MKISNNLFIITGGAGGIGKAVSTILTSKGALVALFDVLDESKGSEVAKQIGDKAVYVQVDITESDSVKKVSLSMSSWLHPRVTSAYRSHLLRDRESRPHRTTSSPSSNPAQASYPDASTAPGSPSNRNGPTTWSTRSPTLKRC